MKYGIATSLLLSGPASWVLACVPLLCFRADAQAVGGALSGAVTAAQHAVPNAKVTIRNVATRAERVVTTEAGGMYATPNLVPGNYEITVEAPGFSTQMRTDISVAVGTKLAVNVAMQEGDPKEIIRAAAVGTSEDQASSAPNANVNSSTVRDSPLNGRDWTQLAAHFRICRLRRAAPVSGRDSCGYGSVAASPERHALDRSGPSGSGGGTVSERVLSAAERACVG